MTSTRTLLLFFTLSIIFTDQIEARRLNKTHNSDNKECVVNNTSANKRSVKVNQRDKHDTLLIKKTYPHQRSDTNLESKYDILARCKYNFKSKHIENEDSDSNKAEEECDEYIKPKTTTTPVKKELTSFKNRKDFSNEEKNSGYAHQVNSNNIIQKTDIDRIKHDSETKLTSNDESSLPNKGQEDHQTVKRQKHNMLTIKHHNTKKRTTQTITDKPLILKRIHGRTTEVDDEGCKTKHRDYTNHRSVERLSQENDIYKLKHRDEITTATKDDNELKHYYSKRNKSYRKLLPDNESVKKSDNSHTLSKENEIYKLENRVDIPSVEMPITKKVKPKYKPKFTHNFQKKKLSKKVSDKTKYKSKIKHDKVVSKEDKPTKTGNKEKHTKVRKGDYNVNSKDTLKPDKKDAQTSSGSNNDEKETLDSSEESLQQNNLLKKPKLPFYVTSRTLTKKEIAKKYPKKQVLKKDDAEIMSDDLNKFLTGKTNLRNKKIDINKVMDQVASSKVLDFITDRVAGHMLKKLQSDQAFKSHITTTDEEPEKVEKIDIVFKNDGDMVMKKAETVEI